MPAMFPPLASWCLLALQYILLFDVGFGADVVLCAICDGLFVVCFGYNVILCADLGHTMFCCVLTLGAR
jgi:hypothetical protein